MSRLPAAVLLGLLALLPARAALAAPTAAPLVSPAARADILRILELTGELPPPGTDPESLVAAYARRFSPSELHEVRRFYESDVGRRLITEAPALRREAVVPEEGGAVLAVIDGTPITEAQLRSAALHKVPADGPNLSEAEMTTVLDGLVADTLLVHEARRRGLEDDPKVRTVVVNTLLRDDVYSKVTASDFTEAELEAYFKAHEDEFVVPEKVQIQHLFIKIGPDRPEAEARARIAELRRSILADPASFKDVAAASSEDPYRRRGGDVGFVSREGKPGLEPEIVEAAWPLPVGGVSEVFKTDTGYHLVRVPARREAVRRTFQQMKGSVLRKVKNDAMHLRYDGYVADLARAAHVERHPDRLRGLEVRGGVSSPPSGMAVPDADADAYAAAEAPDAELPDEPSAFEPREEPPRGVIVASSTAGPFAIERGDPIILGALDRSYVDAVVIHGMPRISECYERGGGVHPIGKVVVKFVIDKTGHVTAADTKSTTLGAPVVESCLNDAFRSFAFPEPKGGGIVIVSYPLITSAVN